MSPLRSAVPVLLLAALVAACGSASGPSAAPGSGSTAPAESPVYRPDPSSSSVPAASPSTAPVRARAVASAPTGSAATSARSSATPAAKAPSAAGRPQPAYRFAAAARPTGSTPERVLSLADLTTTADRALTVEVTVGQPGSVYLNRYASASSFPLNTVRACLRAQAGPACTPTAVPNPAYWPVTATDLQHTGGYQLVVAVSPTTSALLGLHVGWDGPGRAAVGGLRAPGGCTGKTGYKAGCGLRAHLTVRAGGPVTLSSATPQLKAVIKDKTAGSKLASQVLRGSVTVTMPAGHEWAMHLYPDRGSPVGDLALSVTWP